MKNVIIVPRISYLKDRNELQAQIDTKWFQFLEKCSINPIVVATEDSLSDLYLSRNNIAGILLTGGNDLGTIIASTENLYRDRLDRRSIELSLKNSLPLLGVCRGAQSIGNYFGSEPVPLDGHAGVEHLIDYVHPLLVSNYGNQKSQNSYHRYGFREVLPPIEMLALNHSDSTVEAFAVFGSKMLGIMWHPERHNLFFDADIFLFRTQFNVN